MTSIHLVRHPKPQNNDGTIHGQSHNPVKDKHRLQVKDRLNDLCSTVDTIISSPLPRCKTLAHQLPHPFRTEPRLKELDFGQWEEQRWDDIDEKAKTRWMSNYITHPPPGGESMQDLSKRVLAAFHEIEQSDENVLLITHAGPIRTILSDILDMPPDKTFSITIPYGSITTVRQQNDRYTVQFHQ